MENLLPSPKNGSAAIRVPFLSSFGYQHVVGGFESLRGVRPIPGSRNVTTIDDVAILDLERRVSFLQAWLFFGLISEFFQREISPEPSFVQERGNGNPGFVVVDPVIMDRLFVDWVNELSQLPKQTLEARIRATMAIIDFAADQCERFDETGYKSGDLEARIVIYNFAVVMLSVKLLISYLRSSIELYFQAQSESSSIPWHKSFLGLGQLNSSARMKHVLANAGKVVGGDSHTKKMVPMPPGGKESLTFWILFNRFRGNNWCPIRARQLCRAHSYTVVNYLSRVQRHDPQPISHDRCDFTTKCEAYNVKNESAYKPRHTSPNCPCKDMVIKIDVLVAAIEEGFIPILSIDPQAPDLDIKLLRQNGTSPYIAISHVWSDGLGNIHRNALPLCQLKRLASIFTVMKQKKRSDTPGAERWYSGQSISKYRKASRRVYFWMDTLCIPVKPAKPESEGGTPLKELKRRAIRHITPIFQGADQILVLDAEIEQMQLSSSINEQKLLMTKDQIDRDEEELTARILGCKWLQRAWTLEEGALARDCQFKVAGEGTMALGELVPPDLLSRVSVKLARKWERESKKRQKKERKRRKHKNNSGLLMAVVNSNNERLVHFDTSLKLLLAGPLNESRKQAARPGKGKKELQIFIKTRPKQFVEAWNNLLERVATKTDDSVLIFANILDFNSGLIAKIEDVSARLPTLVKSCQELPLGLLFNTSRTQSGNVHPRDSWIPTKIEGDPLVHDSIMRKWKATFGSQVGLEIDTHSSPAGSPLVCYLHPQIPFQTLNFCLEIQNEQGFGPYVIEVLSITWLNNVSDFSFTSSRAAYEEGRGTCIIIDHSAGTDSINGYAGRGARLSILNSPTSQDPVFVRYDSPIRVWAYKQWLLRNPSSNLPRHVASCNYLPPKQKLILEYNTDSWTQSQRQRDLLPAPSAEAATVRGLAAGVVGLVAATAVTQVLVPSCGYSSNSDGSGVDGSTDGSLSGNCVALRLGSEMAVVVLSNLLFFWTWTWYRRRMFRKWLRTFDDK